MTIALKSRFLVTGLLYVAIPTLDSCEVQYSGPFCEEKTVPWSRELKLLTYYASYTKLVSMVKIIRCRSLEGLA